MDALVRFNLSAIELKLSNVHLLKAWRQTHKGKARRARIGEQLILPDVCQVFVYLGKEYSRIGKGKRGLVTYNKWSSHCALCGKPYSFGKDSRALSLIRTCEEHRGKWRAPRKPAVPRQPRDRPRRPSQAPSRRATPIRDAIRAAIADRALLASSAPLDSIARDAAASLPRPLGLQQDIRLQKARAAIRAMARDGQLQLADDGMQLTLAV